MFKYILLIFSAFLFISCSKSSDNPAESDTGDYLVDWTANSNHFNAKLTGTAGSFANNGLIIDVKIGANNTNPRLKLSASGITANGNYVYNKENNEYDVQFMWYASSVSSDVYGLAYDAAEASGTITITTITSKSVSGSFTAKLGKKNTSTGKFTYVTVNGTFKVPKV